MRYLVRPAVASRTPGRCSTRKAIHAKSVSSPSCSTNCRQHRWSRDHLSRHFLIGMSCWAPLYEQADFVTQLGRGLKSVLKDHECLDELGPDGIRLPDERSFQNRRMFHQSVLDLCWADAVAQRGNLMEVLSSMLRMITCSRSPTNCSRHGQRYLRYHHGSEVLACPGPAGPRGYSQPQISPGGDLRRDCYHAQEKHHRPICEFERSDGVSSPTISVDPPLISSPAARRSDPPITSARLRG